MAKYIWRMEGSETATIPDEKKSSRDSWLRRMPSRMSSDSFIREAEKALRYSLTLSPLHDIENSRRDRRIINACIHRRLTPAITFFKSKECVCTSPFAPSIQSVNHDMSLQPFNAGRACLTASALITAIGPFAADWSASHLFNSRWPPHAKFHDGQTMSFGAALGLLTAYYTWRPTPNPADSLRTAAILGSLYFLTGLSGILYPGSRGMDPEFGEGFPQFWPFLGFSGLPWVGYWLAKGSERR